MAKLPVVASNRRPPVASSHDDIARWLQQAMPALQPIVSQLDALVSETIPGLQYAVKWKKAYYGLPSRGWIMELVAYDVSVNLVFFGGAQFDPPPPLGEGSRYVKIRSVDEAGTAQVRDWIRQAAEHDGWH